MIQSDHEDDRGPKTGDSIALRSVRWTLNERMHRLWAATEAKVLGHGGVTALSEISGLSRIVIQRGIKELEEQAFPDPESGAGGIRRSGAGPKPLTEKSPKLLEDLESLVEPETRGDPMSPLRWTTKSLRTLARELRGMGYEISHTTVGRLLHGLGYSLQANDKVLAGQADHPDRDAQFSFINAQAEKAMAAGNPVLSVDTKKKELIENYKNAGQTWEPKGSPVKVQDHDFPRTKRWARSLPTASTAFRRTKDGSTWERTTIRAPLPWKASVDGGTCRGRRAIPTVRRSW